MNNHLRTHQPQLIFTRKVFPVFKWTHNNLRPHANFFILLCVFRTNNFDKNLVRFYVLVVTKAQMQLHNVYTKQNKSMFSNFMSVKWLVNKSWPELNWTNFAFMVFINLKISKRSKYFFRNNKSVNITRNIKSLL